MKWKKSFIKQGVECRKTGNRFIVNAPYAKSEVVVCLPFKTYCHSRACYKKRMEEGE